MVDEQNLLTPEMAPKPESPQEAPVASEIESAPAPEQKEATPIAPEQEPSETPEESEPVSTEISEAPTAAPPQVQQTAEEKDQLTKDIEAVLAEDLTDVFLQLPPEKRTAFKMAGEEAAGKISVMMSSGKVKAKRILDIIRDWLRLVPGVNKFFLEQEAKIKTDKLMDYYKEQSQVDQNIL